MIDEEVFNSWKQHPVTVEMMKMLHERRESLKAQWEGGSFTDYTKEGTVITNVANMGTCKGYAFVCDLSYEDFMPEQALIQQEEGTGTEHD